MERSRAATGWIACLLAAQSVCCNGGRDMTWIGDYPEEALILPSSDFEKLIEQDSIRLVTREDFDSRPPHTSAPYPPVPTGPSNESALTRSVKPVFLDLNFTKKTSAEMLRLVHSLKNEGIVYRFFGPTADATGATPDTPEGLRKKSIQLARLSLALEKPRQPKARTNQSPAPSFTPSHCEGDEGNHAFFSSDRTAQNTYHASHPQGLLANFDFPLKQHLTCVKSQGNRGTCTSFALASAMEIEISTQLGRTVNLSEQDLYSHDKNLWDVNETVDSQDEAHAFQHMGALSENDGPAYFVPLEKVWIYNPSYARTGASNLNTFGPFQNSCRSYPMPYTQECSETTHQARLKCSDIPSKNSTSQRLCGYSGPLRTGDSFRVEQAAVFWDYNDVSGSMDLFLGFLKSGKAVITGIEVPASLETPDERGFIKYTNETEESLGGHTWIAVGFIETSELNARFGSNAPPADPRGYVIFKNSWGPSYGDQGYAYAPAQWVERYAISASVITGGIEVKH